MEIKQLADFVAVCRAGSFAAASRRLNTSQPGLGYQIKQLEAELDVVLLERHSRGVTLTPAGTAFFQKAEKILEAVTEAKATVVPFRAARRLSVRLGISPTPVRLVERAIAMLSARLPGVDFSLREGLSEDLVDLAVRGELDMAITLGSQRRAGFRLRALYSEKLCLIGKTDMADMPDGAITMQQLAQIPIVTGPRGHFVRERLMTAALEAGVGLHIAQELDMSGLRRSMVVYGNRPTVAAPGVFSDEWQHGVLRAWPIDPVIPLDVSMLVSATLPVEFEQEVVDAIMEVIQPFAPLITRL